MSPPRIRRVVVASVFLGLVLASGIGLRPSPPAPETSGGPALTEDPAPGTAAMRARINPETGELEVSAGMPELSLDPGTKNALRRDSEGLTPVYHPDGSVSVDLQGRYQSASVARLDEAGQVIICSEHADEVSAVLAGEEADPAPQAVVQ